MARTGNTQKKQNKLYKKVRNGSSWGTVLLCLFLTILFIGLVIFLSGFFMQYILETKIAEGYSNVESFSRLYEAGEDSDDIMQYLENVSSDFIVTDKQGNVIFEKGNNTCSKENGYFSLANGKELIKVYSDKKQRVLYPKADNTPGYDLAKALKELEKYSDETRVKFPIWMSVPIKGRSQNFIGKAYFTFNKRDTALAFEVIAGTVGTIFVIIVLMIAFIVRSLINYRRVVRLFYSDPVTSGKNWTWFVRYGDEKIRSFRFRKNSYAVVNLSFVNYRNYCMCHSMNAGEALLVKFNRALMRKTVRGELCAHAHTANFALLMNFDNEENLRKRLLDMMNTLQDVESDHIFILQAGVDVIFPETTSTGKILKRKNISIEKAYNNACSATSEMLDSDALGISFFDNKLLEDQRWVDTVQAHQKKALTGGEFEIYYQPKYDPNTLRLRGAEALIRWESDEYGFVSPGRFIPIFEKNGFITEIDHYMISRVAADQKAWLDAGYRAVPVSVNVSRAHFAEKDLAVQIRDMVDAAGCPHDLLEIELTESAFFDDKNAMIDTIKQLKSFGFMVSMDDFGAGYSSLNSLKDMPLDVLKLDADFFRGEKGGDRADIVISEAIKLAKNLSMLTVAEGVEDKAQVDFLASQGCDMIQGYYFAKPMPKGEYVTRLIGEQAGVQTGANTVEQTVAEAVGQLIEKPDAAPSAAQIAAQTAAAVQTGAQTGALSGADALAAAGVAEQPAAPEQPTPPVIPPESQG